MPPVSWRDLVRSIATSPQLASLELPESFPIDKTIDRQLSDRIANLNQQVAFASVLPHEPALVEPLLGDIAALLDRCLAYHREASELEIKWIVYQLDARLAADVAVLDEQLAIESLDKTAHDIARAGHASAAQMFNAVTGSNEALAAAFGAQATGNANTAQATIDSAVIREQLVSTRFTKLRDYREALEARHTTPGGAHNYLERYTRITTLLFEDFDEAYTKAKCVTFGLETIFAINSTDIDFPDLSIDIQPGPIFRLVLWTRRMMRAVDRLAESELEFEAVLPLVQPIHDVKFIPDPDVIGPDGQPLFTVIQRPFIEQFRFAAAMKAVASGGTGELEFEIPDLFAGHRHARLVGVGLSFVVSDLTQPKFANYRLFSTLVPPPRRYSDGTVRHRPAVTFGSVAAYGTQTAVAFVEGLSIHNQHMQGGWKLFVHRYIGTGGIQLQERSETEIIDFKIHFRVVSEASPFHEIGGPLQGPF